VIGHSFATLLLLLSIMTLVKMNHKLPPRAHLLFFIFKKRRRPVIYDVLNKKMNEARTYRRWPSMGRMYGQTIDSVVIAAG
jgi:hypothetical protein